MDEEKKSMINDQDLGEKWEHLEEKEVKNTHNEIKLIKKKIKYLKERIILYEDELATLEGGLTGKNYAEMEDDALDRLAEMKRTVGDDLTRRF